MRDEAFKIIRSHLEWLSDARYSYDPAAILLEFGREMSVSKKPPRWLRLGPAKGCYSNSAHYALNRTDVTYVEGYAIDLVGPAIPIEHAWLVSQDGKVIDPTWSRSADYFYFGIAFKSAAVAQMITEDGAPNGLLDYSPAARRRLSSRTSLLDALEGNIGDLSAEKQQFIPV